MCSIGGLIANGGSGMHSVKYGTVKDYVMALEVVLPNGEIINTGCKAPKTSSGYDLTRLFVGSEGTLGIITKARLKIHPLPETKAILVATFDHIEDAGRTAVTVLSSGVYRQPEIMDARHDAVNRPDAGFPASRRCSKWTATKRRSPGRLRKSARSANASAAKPWSRRIRTRKNGYGPPGGWSASRSPG
jgi:FAD/FMN-containing dehydrogenase